MIERKEHEFFLIVLEDGRETCLSTKKVCELFECSRQESIEILNELCNEGIMTCEVLTTKNRHLAKALDDNNYEAVTAFANKPKILKIIK